MRWPRRIFLTRHGQTEWNLAGRMQGQLDSALTERGVAQARALGSALTAITGEGPPRWFSSPLGRARRTAELALEEAGLPVSHLEIEPRLTEISFGEFEGLTEAQIAERHPDASRIRRADKWNFEHPGGESYAGACDRVADFLAEVAAEPSIVIVTHVGVSRALRAVCFDLEGREAAYLPHSQDHIHVIEGGELALVPTGPAIPS